MEKFAQILHRATQTVNIMFPVIPFGLAMQLILQKSIPLLLAALALAAFSTWISKRVIDLWLKLTFELGYFYAGRKQTTVTDYVKTEYPVLWRHNETAFIISVILATVSLVAKGFWPVVNRTTFYAMVVLTVVFVLTVSLSYALYLLLYWRNGVDGDRYVSVNYLSNQEGGLFTDIRPIKEVRKVVRNSLSHKAWRPS